MAQGARTQVKRRGPWCSGSRVYAGEPFDREKLIEKAASFQPFAIKVCPEADRDHAESLRQYRHVGPHGDNVICVAEAFLDLPRDHRDGLIGHEIGHLIAYPDGAEAAADAAFKTLSGITIRYKDGPYGECLQWITAEDSKKLEDVFEFDLSALSKAKAKAVNPVDEDETDVGRQKRLKVEWHAITKAIEDLEQFTRDTEWADEVSRRLAHAMTTANRRASRRVGQKFVDKVWLEVVRKAQRVREKNRDLGERVEKFLRLSLTPQGRSAIQAEIDAKKAAEQAARSIEVEAPRLPSLLPTRRIGPSEDERRQIREEAIREIEQVMEQLPKAEAKLEREPRQAHAGLRGAAQAR